MNTNESEQVDPVKVYEKLLKAMPSIGFLSRKKRIRAYVKVTNQAQEMVDNEEITEDEALFILSLMGKKSHNFRKASMMTVLNLEHIQEGVLKSVGLRYANEMRSNLHLPPVNKPI